MDRLLACLLGKEGEDNGKDDKNKNLEQFVSAHFSSKKATQFALHWKFTSVEDAVTEQGAQPRTARQFRKQEKI